MCHRASPSCRPQPCARRAPRAMFWILACSTPMALAQAPGTPDLAVQGFDGSVSLVDRPHVPPLALAVLPSLPSALPGQSGHDIGLNWRTRLADDRVIDITAWRRVPQQPFNAISQIRQRDLLYGARVEMKLTPARSRFATELRAIGLQLDNGARILLRRKDGNPTLYYRMQF